VVFLPLMRGAVKYIPIFWAKPGLASIPLFYIFLLRDAVPPMVALLILDPLIRVTSRWMAGTDPVRHARFPLPAPQLVAAVGFAVLPLLMVIVAKFTTGAFTARYALPAVLGLSLLVTTAGHRYANGWAREGVLMALVFSGWFFASSGWLLATPGIRLRAGEETVVQQGGASESLALASREDSPIVVPDADLYLELVNSLSPSRSSHLSFVGMDDDSATFSRALHVLSRWAPFSLCVVDFSSLLESRGSFLVYKRKSSKSGNWFIPALAERKALVEVVGEHGDYIVFSVKSQRASE
jgi:hypothetical protein